MTSNYSPPCDDCTYMGTVEAGDIQADVFCCESKPDEGSASQFNPFSIIILKWDDDNGGDQQDSECLARGFPGRHDTDPQEHCIGELDGVPLRDLWAQALHLIVQKAREG